jgi:hypothetical protein
MGELEKIQGTRIDIQKLGKKVGLRGMHRKTYLTAFIP